MCYDRQTPIVKVLLCVTALLPDRVYLFKQIQTNKQTTTMSVNQGPQLRRESQNKTTKKKQHKVRRRTTRASVAVPATASLPNDVDGLTNTQTDKHTSTLIRFIYGCVVCLFVCPCVMRRTPYRSIARKREQTKTQSKEKRKRIFTNQQRERNKLRNNKNAQHESLCRNCESVFAVNDGCGLMSPLGGQNGLRR